MGPRFGNNSMWRTVREKGIIQWNRPKLKMDEPKRDGNDLDFYVCFSFFSQQKNLIFSVDFR